VPHLRRRSGAGRARRRRAPHLAPKDRGSPRAPDFDRHFLIRLAFAAPVGHDPSVVRLLFIGDIVGRPGRDLVKEGLAALVDHHGIALVIANVENAAAGFGITRELGDQLLDVGIDVMTSGNHIWDKKEALDYIGVEPRLLRPANYPAGVPGNGSYL